MVKCPTCEKEVETPIMKWDMGKNKRYMLSSMSVAGKNSANAEREFRN